MNSGKTLISYLIISLFAATPHALACDRSFGLSNDDAKNAIKLATNNRIEKRFLDYQETMSGEYFIVFEALPDQGDGALDYFGVNRWTGDVWSLWSCKKLSSKIYSKYKNKLCISAPAAEGKKHAGALVASPPCINN